MGSEYGWPGIIAPAKALPRGGGWEKALQEERWHPPAREGESMHPCKLSVHPGPPWDRARMGALLLAKLQSRTLKERRQCKKKGAGKRKQKDQSGQGNMKERKEKEGRGEKRCYGGC